MKIRLTLVMGAALLAAGTGWSQNRLGEVAGSIKLNPEAIVEKEGFIEDRQVAQEEDRELFGTVLSGCLATADSLGNLIDEARNNILYRNEKLVNLLSATSLELDTRLLEFDLIRLGEVFNESAETARGAIDSCNAGTNAVREELARRGLAFTLAGEEINRCRQELHRSVAQLESVGQTAEEAAAAAVDTAEFAASNTDEAIVDAVCESERGKGQEAFDACEGRQYGALAALGSRTPENELLDAAVFNAIRQICTKLNPSDFDARNLCEIDRMTTTRLESE